MTMGPFLAHKEHGQITAAILASGYLDNFVLASDTAETVTRPTGANIVVFSADVDFWVNWHGATAAVPSVDQTDGAAEELNPVARSVGHLTTFSIVAAAACKLSLAWYGKTP